MAIRYYDQAIVDKIKSWIKDPNLVVLSPNESTRLFQMRADQLNDRPLNLPMISISRDSHIEIINPQKRALSYDGNHITFEESDLNRSTEEISKVLNAIPIELKYQLDIYTKYFEEADEYVRNFIFNLINYPKLTIELPYNDSHLLHDSTILVDSTISDNSDISERLISGQFTRMTIRLTIDDAYLFSIPFMANWKIEESGIEIIDK